MRRLALALTAGALVLGGVGCGGDDEKATDTTPTISVETEPPTDTATTPAPATTPPPTTPSAPAPTRTTPPSGGSGGTTAPAAPRRTTPPPAPKAKPGEDPADAFDRYCKEHPGACG